jgi:cell division protein FtsN
MAKGPRATLRLIDRIVLMVAWVVTCGLVYVLGYYVGKGTPGRQATVEERAVRLPVTSVPPPEGQRPRESKEFPTFYQALPSGDRPIDVARGATGGTAPPASVATTTLPRPTTTLPRAPATSPTTLPRATTSVPASTRPIPTTTTPPRPPSPPTTIARSAVSPATPPPSVPPATPAPRQTGGSYTVEASPTRSRSEAEQLLAALRRRGYEATLVEVERDGDTWYRLRVGRYQTSAQATEAMRRLRDVEGVTHAFVATD